MTGGEAIATALGGLGLFFIGVKDLGGNLQRLSGQRVRALLARASAGPVRAAVSGVVIGIVIQSSNAATLVTTSLVTAGLLPLRAALTVAAWSNVGPAALVLLASFDLRLAVLYLLGVTGFATLFGVGGAPRWQPLLKAVIALGTALLGLSIFQGTKAALQALDPASLAHNPFATGLLGPYAGGALAAFVVQSSSAPAILAMKLGESGLLSYDQLVAVIYGGSLGSGLVLLVTGRHVRGSARQVVLFQSLFKCAGALLFTAWFGLEQAAGLPGPVRLAQAVVQGQEGSLPVLFMLVQLGGCLAFALVWGPVSRLVARMAPATPSEALGQPRYLYPQAAQDPATGVALAARELAALQARLPFLLDPVREGATPGPATDALMQGGVALEAEIGRFLDDVLARSCPPATVGQTVVLETRLDLVRTLRETLAGFATVLGQVTHAPAQAITAPLAESLHFLLEQLNEAQSEADLALVADLSADRGEMMAALRRRAAAAGGALPQAVQDQVFRATTLFERAVWLVRRLALLAG